MDRLLICSFLLDRKCTLLNNLAHDIDGTHHGSIFIVLVIMCERFSVVPMFQPQESIRFLDLFKNLQIEPTLTKLVRLFQHVKRLEKLDPFVRVDLD